MRIVVLGLSITSSWGNGHATTYRALLRGLHALGHHTLFLERDKPWYRENRDVPDLPFARVELYDSLAELDSRFTGQVRDADLVIIGSYVPEGVQVAEWVHRNASGITAFYDIDTPVTLAKLARGEEEYLAVNAIPRFGIYLSFTGGPVLRKIEREFGASMARALYCSIDPQFYFPDRRPPDWLLGYLGTYSADRQPALERFLFEPARIYDDQLFAVAGPLYPDDVEWPPNVQRMEHLPPGQHRAFYNGQQFTLNVTRQNMVEAGYSPSVRLFEAAACATPVITDYWPGLETFFVPGEEILVARTADDVIRTLTRLSDADRATIGRLARKRVLAGNTALDRARQIEQYVQEYNQLARPALPVLAGRRRGKQ